MKKSITRLTDEANIEFMIENGLKKDNFITYSLELIPRHGNNGYYVIKRYFKGLVETCNQYIQGRLFYNRWEQYSRDSVAIIRD